MIKNNLPSQKESFELMNEKEKIKFIIGGCCYDYETREGKKVFTLRAARKYDIDELYSIIDYMIIADNINILENEKAIIGFGNIVKALREKLPPLTKEEIYKMNECFKKIEKENPDFFNHR